MYLGVLLYLVRLYSILEPPAQDQLERNDKKHVIFDSPWPNKPESGEVKMG
jgi:hypothetical protein